MSVEAQAVGKRVIVLFGLWLITMMVCNDMTNYGGVRVGVNIRLDRIVYAALVLAFLGEYSRRQERIPWNREELLMLLFFIVSLGSCVVFGAISAPNNRYLAQLTNFTILPASFFAIARRMVFGVEQLKMLSRFFKIIGAYLAVTGVCEHYEINALIFPKYILDPGVGLHYGRARGPFGSSVVMGGALTLIFFWVLWEQMNLKRSKLNIVLLLIIAVSIYFTETRSVWLFFAASLAVLAILSKELRKPCYCVLAGLALLYFSGVASKFSVYEATLFSRRQGPIDDRKNIMYASYKMFLAKPILGFGYGNYLKYSGAFFTELDGVPLRGEGEGQHNTLLGLLTEMGLVGTIPYCLILYYLFRTCYRGLRDFRSERRLERSIVVTQIALLSGLLVYMQFSDIRFYNFVNCLTFWMAGIVYSNATRVAEETALNPVAQLSRAAA